MINSRISGGDIIHSRSRTAPHMIYTCRIRPLTFISEREREVTSERGDECCHMLSSVKRWRGMTDSRWCGGAAVQR